MPLIYKGEELPCDVPVYDWTQHGMRFTRARGGIRLMRRAASLITGHWTGAENDERKIFRNLGRRRTRDGRGLSVQLFINYQGEVFQFCDLKYAARHASAVNYRSIGIEMQNRAFDRGRRTPARWDRESPRRYYTDKLKGRERKLARFTPLQMASWISVCEALCAGLGIPRRVPISEDVAFYKTFRLPVCGRVRRTNIPRRANRTFKGVIGHYHVSKKLDPGPQPLELLVDEGFELVAP